MPNQLQQRVLHALHNGNLAGGHRGRESTYDKIKRRFWWKGISKDVKNFVRACDICQTVKGAQQLHAGLTPIKTVPFKRMVMDFMSGIPETVRGMKYILALVCPDSGRTILTPCKTRSGIEVANAILNAIILGGYTPEEIQSDNAPEFVSGVVAKLEHLLGIHGLSGTPYKPAVQGAVERRNFTVARILATMCNSAGDDWDLKLRFVEHTINTSIYSGTGMTPFAFIHGFDHMTPFDRLMEVPIAADKPLDMWHEALLTSRNIAALSQERAKADMKERYDKDKPTHNFAVGDEVFVYWPSRDRKKMHVDFVGPYIIDKFMQDEKRSVTVHHKDFPNDHTVAHVDRLLPRHQLPADFHADDEVWRQWTADASQNVPTKEFEEPPPDMDVREREAVDDDEYEVEAIIAHKDEKGARKKDIRSYKVRFKGYSPTADLWIEENDLRSSAAELVDAYELALQDEEEKQRATRSAVRKLHRKTAAGPTSGRGATRGLSKGL